MRDDDPLDDDLLARALGAPTHDESRRPWETQRDWRRLSARIAADAEPSAGVRASSPVRSLLRSGAIRLLASAAVAIAVVGSVLVVRRAEAPAYRTMSTTRGQRLSLELDDGTEIIIGPASTIRYAIGSSARHVELSGLAEFRVVHDSAHPFTVHAGSAEATDLGTTFTVRAFPGDSSVVVAVTEGMVALHARTGSLSLAAGQVGLANRGGLARSDLPASRYTEWTQGRLSFTDAPLSEVVAELSRWFDADVRVDDRLASRRVSGAYVSPTLGTVLDALARTTGARIDRTSSTAWRTYVLRPASTAEPR
jgi:transmembrane sensor